MPLYRYMLKWFRQSADPPSLVLGSSPHRRLVVSFLNEQSRKGRLRGVTSVSPITGGGGIEITPPGDSSNQIPV